MRVYKFLEAKWAIENIKKKRLKVSRVNDLNDPCESIFAYSDSCSIDMTRFVDFIDKRQGLLCFSKKYDCHLLWAHYAEKHQGICLGFDIPDITTKPSGSDRYRKVIYKKKPVKFPKNQDNKSLASFLTNLVFIKFEAWRYEQEVRVWGNVNRDKNDNIYNEDGLYFSNFDDNLKLKEVIIGMRCCVKDGEAIRDQLNHYN
jgi:hypothetical protein